MKNTRFFAILFLLFLAFPAYAAPYTPLVQIPGLGETVTISSYLIGIYNFLLSIVGIVAVLMLIIGGMRYISAAGNASAIGEAKSTIEGAVGGLLLALLSWLIVSTINPDILYVKQPGMTNPGSGSALSSSSFSLDGNCIAPSSYTGNEGNVDECICADGSVVDYTSGTCDAICSSLKKCGNKFLVVKLSTGIKDDIRVATAIWQFFLTNDGRYDEFDVSAEHYLGNDVLSGSNTDYSCGILATEENNGNDANYIFWAKNGSTIGPDDFSFWNEFYREDGGSYLYYCNNCETGGGPADCNLNTLGQCGRDEATHVLQARFDDKVEDKCDETNCTLAEWKGNIPTYRLARQITCVNGYWR